MTENLGSRDYVRGKLRLITESTMVVFILAYYFYKSLWAAIPLSILGFLYYKYRQKLERNKKDDELRNQFKECILSVSGLLRAGYSVENAFVESRNDMKMLYGEKSQIYRELEIIKRGLIINISLEELLFEFAKRSKIEEISQFADIFSIAKRNSGSMVEIITSTSSLIGQRIDMKKEMDTILSGRRLEQLIMQLMPFGILTYIGVGYKGFFDVLYFNVSGFMIMSMCLMLYVFSFYLGVKTIDRIARDM